MPDHKQFSPDLVAKNQSLTSCPVCNSLSLSSESRCSSCNSVLHSRMPKSLQRTIALLITSCILYIPANTFTILRSEGLEGSVEKTIIGSIILFIDQGSYVLAMIVFTASIIVPIGKIVALSWLCLCVITPRWSQPLRNTRLYRLTEIFGRWSMIDVFVVALLSSLIQLDGLMVITPGIAIMAFAGVVITTMLATMSFDTRLIWDRWEKNNER